MVFSSQVFLFFFLPVTLCLYYAIPWRGKHLVLTLLSYFFYSWANPLFVVLLFTSTLVDYVCALRIANSGPIWLAHLIRRDDLVAQWSHPIRAITPETPRNRTQRWACVISICTNLSLLGFFKYFNFALDNLSALSEILNLPWLDIDLALRITLPLGISFYTFQSMSYTIDIYRGRAAALRNFVDFSCYVSMFPQLVAGPIIRFTEVADQIKHRSHTLSKASRGIALFSVGLAKKVLIANPCGRIADIVFDAGSITTIDAWYGTIAYAFQIYFDFSAYSDMAIGLGLMLGFVFPKNFDSPYHAVSITDFWRRWHISLSSWLRDYLYVPLGGNRLGTLRTYRNLFIVMILGGLWHGAAWNFLVWGALHGALLVIERLNKQKPFYASAPKPLSILLTFLSVLITWVFFRATDMSHALNILSSMFGVTNPEITATLVSGILYQPYYLLTFTLAGIITWGAPQAWEWTQNITHSKGIIVILLLLISIALLSTQAYNPFIYFIF